MEEPWGSLLRAFTGGKALRPIQRLAVENEVLLSRRHLVVSSPPNSGKTLVGYMVILETVLRGQRAILLEPLRALAQEHAETLDEVLKQWGREQGLAAPSIQISTGDYRHHGELLSDAPPKGGEIIVATPERLEAILRQPESAEWLATVGAVVVDEAHLIGDERRGPTLELLIAILLSSPAPPRIALLSGTLSFPEKIQDWLQPCQLLVSDARSPLLREVWALAADEQPDELLSREVGEILQDGAHSCLVFVFTRRNAEVLASTLQQRLNRTVHAYHSGQSAHTRALVRRNFESGECRCVVATTALAMGVNLPATHVFVRDTTFFGTGRLDVGSLIQILGRAGRSDRSGYAAVLVRAQDDWAAEELADLLAREEVPPIRSSFELAKDGSGRSQADAAARVAELVAICLARAGHDGTSESALTTLLGNTLAGRTLNRRIPEGLQWLTSPQRSLAYRTDAANCALTKLGRASIRAVLPLDYAWRFAQLVRDLLSLDWQLLERWSPVDHLFVTALLARSTPGLRAYSARLSEQVDAWVEAQGHERRSLLFCSWVTGSPATSKVDELFGSLGLSDVPSREAMHKRAYSSMLAAIVLNDRAQGVAVGDLEARWALHGLDGIEEGWRDTTIWLLSGHPAILDVPNFYFHLRDACDASPEAVLQIKKAFRRLRNQVFGLLEGLRFCSPLGAIAQGVRRTRGDGKPTVGAASIRRLEEAGVRTLEQVAYMTVDELVASGVQKRYARQIRSYLQRRLV